VSVWKDSRDLGREAATAAVSLANGKKVDGAITFNGGEKKVSMQAMLLKPIPVTAANLDLVIKGGWISKDAACKGVDKAAGPAACK
jgi:D-xylose transport system substrate-binding protein